MIHLVFIFLRYSYYNTFVHFVKILFIDNYEFCVIIKIHRKRSDYHERW